MFTPYMELLALLCGQIIKNQKICNLYQKKQNSRNHIEIEL